MKKSLPLLAIILLFTNLGCNNYDFDAHLADKKVEPRRPDCNIDDYKIILEHYLGKCKHDCNKGVGFRCGATRYICRYGELQVLEEIPENCNQAPSTIWTEKDTLDHTLLSHPSVISMEIEILNTDSARITFLEPIPVGWLSEDPYLTIDHSLRLSHYGGLSLNNTIYYHFRFETGDYLIDTVSTAYGTTIVYIDPS